MYDLSRFTQAHERVYAAALAEIRSGRKHGHWMWYIFPQLKGLGHSSTAAFYGISNLEEAQAFLQDPVLGAHLREISGALLQLPECDARAIFGGVDAMKLRSSMTLFSAAAKDEDVFRQVLEKFFRGKPDYRTLQMLGLEYEAASGHQATEEKRQDDRVVSIEDDNIQNLRNKHPNGLHFVVGDTHGHHKALRQLMEKIAFDPQRDHIWFVGDYNAGGDVTELLRYIAQYYQADYSIPGFHLIRGNHERELGPIYALENLPDIAVLRGRVMNYYLVHAGMVDMGFDLINADMRENPDEEVYAYALEDSSVCYDAPLRKIIWSRHGQYSQRSQYRVWPPEESLYQAKACIIHGHTPFVYLKKGNYYSYGDRMLLWKNQRIWFAEDLQSFDIDSNIKGRFDPSDHYCGLSCVCLEVLDEIAERGNGFLTREEIRKAENFVFSVPHTPNDYRSAAGDLSRVLEASPKMKQIGLDAEGEALLYTMRHT